MECPFPRTLLDLASLVVPQKRLNQHQLMMERKKLVKTPLVMVCLVSLALGIVLDHFLEKTSSPAVGVALDGSDFVVEA